MSGCGVTRHTPLVGAATPEARLLGGKRGGKYGQECNYTGQGSNALGGHGVARQAGC